MDISKLNIDQTKAPSVSQCARDTVSAFGNQEFTLRHVYAAMIKEHPWVAERDKKKVMRILATIIPDWDQVDRVRTGHPSWFRRKCSD